LFTLDTTQSSTSPLKGLTARPHLELLLLWPAAQICLLAKRTLLFMPNTFGHFQTTAPPCKSAENDTHAHLVHAGHNAVKHFTLEGPECDALELGFEGGEAAAILPDLALKANSSSSSSSSVKSKEDGLAPHWKLGLEGGKAAAILPDLALKAAKQQQQQQQQQEQCVTQRQCCVC
jgi:hypothetical protein